MHKAFYIVFMMPTEPSFSLMGTLYVCKSDVLETHSSQLAIRPECESLQTGFV